ncbi:hypothetical protein Prudu_018423, partial [Prunus dulcis]
WPNAYSISNPGHAAESRVKRQLSKQVQSTKTKVKRHRMKQKGVTKPQIYDKEETLPGPHNGIGSVIGTFVGDQRHEHEERRRGKKSSLTPRWRPWFIELTVEIGHYTPWQLAQDVMWIDRGTDSGSSISFKDI